MNSAGLYRKLAQLHWYSWEKMVGNFTSFAKNSEADNRLKAKLLPKKEQQKCN